MSFGTRPPLWDDQNHACDHGGISIIPIAAAPPVPPLRTTHWARLQRACWAVAAVIRSSPGKNKVPGARDAAFTPRLSDNQHVTDRLDDAG